MFLRNLQDAVKNVTESIDSSLSRKRNLRSPDRRRDVSASSAEPADAASAHPQEPSSQVTSSLKKTSRMISNFFEKGLGAGTDASPSSSAESAPRVQDSDLRLASPAPPAKKVSSYRLAVKLSTSTDSRDPIRVRIRERKSVARPVAPAGGLSASSIVDAADAPSMALEQGTAQLAALQDDVRPPSPRQVAAAASIASADPRSRSGSTGRRQTAGLVSIEDPGLMQRELVSMFEKYCHSDPSVVSEFSKGIALLARRLSDAAHPASTPCTNCQTLTGQLRRLQMEYARVAREHQACESKMSQATARIDELALAHRDSTDLVDKLKLIASASGKELNSVSKELADSKQRLAAMTQDLSDARHKYQSVVADRDRAVERVRAEMTSQMRLAEQVHNASERELEEKLARWHRQNQELLSKTQAAQSPLAAETESMLLDLKNMIANVERENTVLRQRLSDETASVSSKAEEQVQEIQVLRARVAEEDEQLAQALRTIEHQTASLAQKDAWIAELEQQNRSLSLDTTRLQQQMATALGRLRVLEGARGPPASSTFPGHQVAMPPGGSSRTAGRRSEDPSAGQGPEETSARTEGGRTGAGATAAGSSLVLDFQPVSPGWDVLEADTNLSDHSHEGIGRSSLERSLFGEEAGALSGTHMASPYISLKRGSSDYCDEDPSTVRLSVPSQGGSAEIGPDEVHRLRRMLDQLITQVSRLRASNRQLKNVKQRYDCALQLIAEKDDAIQELKDDLAYVKTTFQQQLTELLTK